MFDLCLFLISAYDFRDLIDRQCHNGSWNPGQGFENFSHLRGMLHMYLSKKVFFHSNI